MREIAPVVQPPPVELEEPESTLLTRQPAQVWEAKFDEPPHPAERGLSEPESTARAGSAESEVASAESPGADFNPDADAKASVSPVKVEATPTVDPTVAVKLETSAPAVQTAGSQPTSPASP